MSASEEPLDSPIGFVAEHTRRYIETGGAEGHDFNGAPCLILTTRGRRSGRLRRNALIYGRDSGRYVVIASKGGAERNPLWFENLSRDARAQIQVRSDVINVRARLAESGERGALWSLMCSIWPDYQRYQEKTNRQLPVVLLEPIDNLSP